MQVSIYDAPAIMLIGYVFAIIHAKILLPKHPTAFFFFGVGVTLVFWLNILLTHWGIMEPWGGLLPAAEVNPWVGVFYVLSLPMWLKWGAERAFQTQGRTPSQGGTRWVLGLKDKTKPFTPTWKESDK